MNAKKLHIEAAFDLVCPWCLIGKRQLDLALQDFRRLYPETVVSVVWQPVQLLPQIPSQGLPYLDFYANRLGTLAAVSARQEQVRHAAAQVGLTLNFSAIAIMPNTARAHALLALMAKWQPANHAAMIEQLFNAFFLTGKDIGDSAILRAMGAGWGLPDAEVSAALADAAPLPASMSTAQGVPNFRFNGEHSLSGAQPAHWLLTMMETATRTQALSSEMCS